MFKKIIPTLFTAGQLICCGLLFGSAKLPAAEKQSAVGMDIKFTTAREGTVLVNIYKGAMPFVIADLFWLALLLAFPSISLFLVKLIG